MTSGVYTEEEVIIDATCKDQQLLTIIVNIDPVQPIWVCSDSLSSMDGRM